MLVAISGGAGFLGLHLAGRLLADGHALRTLDVAPLDEPELEQHVDEVRGDVRDESVAARLAGGADVLVHAAAALPIQASRAAIRSVNVDGTATTLGACRDAGVRRAVLISSTAVYGTPDHHPIDDTDPLETFIGPERLGVFEILLDWIREGRGIPILGDGSNRYQLLAVEDLFDAVVRSFHAADAAGEAVNLGPARFATVRDDLDALIDHAGSRSHVRPVPPRAAELALCWPELLRLSPLAEWHYRTAHKDLFVSVEKARRLFGWEPRLPNAETLCAAFDWYLAHRDLLGEAGTTHRVRWNQGVLGLLRRVS
jgi:nucleoside-diphosphate-sugar epimerase